METRTYTHRDLARQLGVSETTIKSYRAKFPAFLPVARQGKPVRLHAEALDVCRRIRDLFAEGLSIGQTEQTLRGEFKEYPLNRRLSTPGRTAPGEEAGSVVAALGEQLRALSETQAAALERLERLESAVRNLVTLEASSKSLTAELLGELRAARSARAEKRPAQADAEDAPAAQTKTPDQPATAEKSAPQEAPARKADEREWTLAARKIVTVHGREGAAASYAFGREPKPEPPFTAPARPPADFLELPAVIRSGRGDFLGLPGGQGVGRLADSLKAEGAPVWLAEEGEDAWTCIIPITPARRREMRFERTRTPRGNLVGLIRRMSLDGTEATPAQLQEFFRRLRDRRPEKN